MPVYCASQRLKRTDTLQAIGTTTKRLILTSCGAILKNLHLLRLSCANRTNTRRTTALPHCGTPCGTFTINSAPARASFCFIRRSETLQQIAQFFKTILSRTTVAATISNILRRPARRNARINTPADSFSERKHQEIYFRHLTPKSESALA